MSEPLPIGLLGLGTVGGAFHELLSERASVIEALSGRRPEVRAVLVRDVAGREGPLTTDPDEVLREAEIVVELMGGTEPARELVLGALRSGKHVVSANKQLISQHGDELFQAARESGVQLRFEAAVAGVIPVIRVVRESLAGAHVEKMHGIVNGTTNYILSEMARTGASYGDALKQAQELGYAEADPSEDVNGSDAAAKMAILARLAFHSSIHLDQVEAEGIEEITADDIAYAKEFDLVLKLLGVAERRDGGMSVRVFPCFIGHHHPLASVGGPFNAVMVESEAITEITMSGPGAGGPQTASAVLGDVVSIMTTSGGELPEPLESLALVPGAQISSSFYLHVEVEDRPGVLAELSGVLGRHEVSVQSAVQKGLEHNARLVFVMHPVREANFYAAVEEIAKLDLLRAPPRAIRVIEEEFG